MMGQKQQPNTIYQSADVELHLATIRHDLSDLIAEMRIESDVFCAVQSAQLPKLPEPGAFNYSLEVAHNDERGVGRNRNVALKGAKNRIALLADDDLIYMPNYSEIVSSAFNELPEADVIFFNLFEENSQRSQTRQIHRVHWWNFARYGAARTAFKLEAVKTAGISFNENFGGGARFLHGEDTIFFYDCLRKGLKLYSVPITVAEHRNERSSSWNDGTYGEKYLHDQGALYRAMSPKAWPLWCLQDAFRHRKRYQRSVRESLLVMLRGVKSYNKIKNKAGH